jgi:gliding motility-associated-like protein
MQRLSRILIFSAFFMLWACIVRAQVHDQVINNGDLTTDVNFPVAGSCLYMWTNSKTSIGLPASGTGNIAAFAAKNTGTTPITATITATPVGASYAYIGSNNNSDLTIINTLTGAVAGNINLGSTADGVLIAANSFAFSPDGSFVYAASTSANVFLVIDAATRAIIKKITGFSGPSSPVVTPDGQYVYVANSYGNTISKIRTSDNTLVKNIDSKLDPNGLAISPDGTKIYSTNFNSGTVSVIDVATDELTTPITVNPYPLYVVMGRDGKYLYISDRYGYITIVNTQTQLIEKTIYVYGVLNGIAISPDGSRVFAANSDQNTIIVLNTATNTIAGSINTSVFPSSVSVSNDSKTLYVANFGDGTVMTYDTNTLANLSTLSLGRTSIASFGGTFISPAANCTSSPVTFNITVNASSTPTITTTPATGTITACEHSASVNPKIQQFTVTGTSLTNDITVSAPLGFDISLDPDNNYNTTLVISQLPNLPGSAAATVYVRASSLAAVGSISGNVLLGSTGAIAQQVPVSGTVYAIATATQKTLPNYTSGQTVPAITFTGTADSYNWTSDNPSIGLSMSSGTNSIPSFTAVNNGTSNVTAHIKVTPISNNGCAGADMLFDIVVKPLGPYVSVGTISGASINTCQGVPSIDYQQFTVSADNLTGTNKIIIKPTNSSIQVSTVQSPIGFVNEIDLSPQTGTVTPVNIYVRISAAAPVGALSSAVNITYVFQDGTVFSRARTPAGAVRAQASVNAVATPQNVIPGVRKTIAFQGTATQYKWTNDNATIGLGFSGFGDIDFVPVNSGATTITAHLKVIPVNSFGCEGTPVPFTIVVPAAQPNVIQVTGNLPLLSTNYGTPSVGGSFKVSGDNMQSGITVTPPLGYEVSTDDITFSKTLTLGSAGDISQTEIFIRLAKNTPAGTYPGNVVMSSTGAADATIAVNPIDAVGKVPLIITADNKTKITGTANPALTASYLGFVNSENSSVLTTQPLLSTTATADSPPGVYPITASGAAAANYVITYAGGTMIVKPQPVNIVVSNAFTPNGDGINDTWTIKNIDGFPNSTVQIFNRYGASIFYSVSYAKPWDGTLKGVNLPTGTYYYVIDLKNGDKPGTGWVAIIR